MNAAQIQPLAGVCALPLGNLCSERANLPAFVSACWASQGRRGARHQSAPRVPGRSHPAGARSGGRGGHADHPRPPRSHPSLAERGRAGLCAGSAGSAGSIQPLTPGTLPLRPHAPSKGSQRRRARPAPRRVCSSGWSPLPRRRPGTSPVPGAPPVQLIRKR